MRGTRGIVGTLADVGRFDRYMLSRLMTLFGFFSLVLVSVYWINRAVGLFDRLIANGHSALVFLEFSALALPNVIRLVLPVSAFAAAIYVVNRLSSDSELVVIQSSGYSPARLARPVLAFGLIVALLVSVLTHLLVPASLRALNERTAEISQDVTARLLTEGEFLHPSDGVTFYIREITPRGELRNVFLSDTVDPAEHRTYTAESAVLLRTDTGPRLVMFDGLVQTLETATASLSTTRFEDFAFDLSSLLDIPGTGEPSPDELPTSDLLPPSPAAVAATGDPPAELIFEGVSRFAQALKAMAAPLLGVSIMLLGGFSRFGLWRQILGAVIAMILFETIDNAAADLAEGAPGLWPVAFAAPLVALGAAVGILWIAARPTLVTRRVAA